jgi:hypothetical protein
MYKFIIYQTEEEGLIKAEEEGRAVGLPYYENPHFVTRYVTRPFLTKDSEWALDVTDYTTLNELELSRVVTEVNATNLN